MSRVRRHPRLLSALAFGLLAFTAELVGRSLTHRLDFGRHVEAGSYAQASYYPVLLALVKVGVALLLARLAWRFVRAQRAARAANRLLGAVGAGPGAAVPKVRLSLSPRLWLLSFGLTSLFFLVQTDAERVAVGRWPLLAPVAPHLRAARVRRARGRGRALLERGLQLALRLRALRARPPSRAPRGSPSLPRRSPRPTRSPTSRSRRAACSGSPSSRARLPCPRNPREALTRLRGSIRGFKPWEERWNRTLQATRPSGSLAARGASGRSGCWARSRSWPASAGRCSSRTG